MTEQKRAQFTVAETSYVANLSTKERREGHPAVFFELRSQSGARGMRFPILLVTNYVQGAQEIAEKVAAILEKHWDDEQEEANP